MSTTMACPSCGSRETRITDSRGDVTGKKVHRRRRCRICGASWTTIEERVGKATVPGSPTIEVKERAA